MKLLYKFIGTEADRKLYVDPEPEVGREYDDDEYMKILESNPFHNASHFEVREIPEEPVNHLTPQMRLEIVKIYPSFFNTLKEVEDYINTGIK